MDNKHKEEPLKESRDIESKPVEGEQNQVREGQDSSIRENEEGHSNTKYPNPDERDKQLKNQDEFTDVTRPNSSKT